MKEERPTYMSEEDIEDLLSPKCDFHASPGFMERVMAEIESDAAPKPRHRAWWRYSAASAAVAALIVATILIASKTETQTDMPTIAFALPMQEGIQPTHAPKINKTQEEMPEEISKKKDNPSLKDKIMNEKNVILAESRKRKASPSEDQENTHEEDTQGKGNIAVIEGPMSSRSDLEAHNSTRLLLSTDDCDDYTRMVRQAYIERVRYEIAETEAYVEEMRKSMIESI